MSKLLKIEIENFKGVSQAVRIPMRAITLLFGANSAGKSTILQALHYAREVVLNHNADPDRTELGGSSIDLGGFKTLVNEHDATKQIRIRIHLKAENSDLESYNAIPIIGLSADDDTLTADFLDDEITIKNVWVEFKTGYLDNRVDILEYSVGLNDDKIGTISRLFEKVVISELNFMHPLFRDENNEMGSFLKERLTEDVPLPANISFGKDPCLIVEKPIEIPGQTSVIPTPDKEFEPIAHIDEDLYKAGSVTPILTSAAANDIPEASTSQYSEFWSLMSRLFIRPLELLSLELKNIRYIAPIRDIVPRNFISPKTEDFARWANGFGAWDVLMKNIEEYDNPDDMSLVNATSEYISERLGLGYTLKAQKQFLLPSDHPLISEIKLLAARFEERSAQHVRSRILDPLLQLPTEKKLVIVDQKNGVEVEPFDVGVGVSQVLPVVVGALEKSASILAVEQPELHVHPAVACNLGDLFIREFVGQDRLCLIETHSEHLVLRLLRRIRETTNRPKDFDASLALSVDDISVITVENNAGVVSMIEIPVREDGEFSKKWPKGFFEEREEELF